MPNYDYECSKCRHVFEVFQRISEEPLKSCPKCGGPVKRLIGGGIGIIFKGSGFYTTDYKKAAAVTGSSGKDGNGGSKGDKEKKTETAASSSSESGSKGESKKPDGGAKKDSSSD